MTRKPIIIKVGTNIITQENGALNTRRIKDLARQIARLAADGTPVILVTSGAMGAGRGRLRLKTKPDQVTERQVLAAVGQVPLMTTYEKYFSAVGLVPAQVLATREDFRDRGHYRTMQHCFAALIENGVVPVVNENDVVATSELMFTDNDELSGLIASMVNAAELFLLTSVDGLLDSSGKTIAAVDKKTDLIAFVRPDKSSFGRGGMASKCAVAQRLAALGVTTYIINGQRAGSVISARAGKVFGTKFLPTGSAPAIKRWLAQSRGVERGAITLNAGALAAVTAAQQAASILPVGVVAVAGDFKKGDIIKVTAPDGNLVGYGRAEYAAGDLKKIIGKKGHRECVHYNYLFLEL